MMIHFHIGQTPVTFTLTKGETLARELEEKTDTLIWYALRFPKEGQRARYTLRRWAGRRRP